MDPVFRFPASPGTPLFPVSPERANRQHLPQSPSLPSNLSSNLSDPFTSSHSRLSSDVQGKVAQFNSLNKEAIQRRKDHEAALKRAVVGREEAEGETRRLRETNDSLRREVEEGRGRERKVGERVESVMVRKPAAQFLRPGSLRTSSTGGTATDEGDPRSFESSIRERGETCQERGIQICQRSCQTTRRIENR